MSIYFNTNKTVFIHNPKTAGTSIHSWFINNVVPSIANSVQASKALHMVPESYNNIDNIIIVTRPLYDQVVSFYNHCKKASDVILADLQNFIELRPDLDLSDKYVDFDTYLTNLENFNNISDELLFKQSNELLFKFIKVHIPTIRSSGKNIIELNFDSLEQDFVQVQNMFNCQVPLPELNTQTYSFTVNQLTDDQKSRINALFVV